ncbi:MAG: C40 family peptidase [Halanaerobiales bacterium]
MENRKFLDDNYERVINRVNKVKDKLLGIPYLHNGRSYQGVDCLGLIFIFFKELGINLPESDGHFIEEDWYKKDPYRYINGLKKIGDEVGHFRNLQVLDILYFRLYKNIITHSGVMLDEKRFLHVLIDKEVRIDSMERRYWRAKYAGARRLFK